MLASRTDLPLERDALARFLPWLIAFMVYLAALALAGVLVLNAMVERWDRGIGGTLTVQMMPAKAGNDAKRIDTALALLRGTEGVLRAQPVDEARVLALLEPWLGGGGTTEDLPLPLLIDVELKPGASVDLEALATRLGKAVPGATVDDHRVWLDRLVSLIHMVEALAGIILLLIALACVGTVVFTTRTGLAIHHEAIEVLHLIGAKDAYVADQFAGRALSLGLRGGILGLVLAVPTLVGIGHLAREVEAGVLPDFNLTLLHWAALAVLPAAAAVIAMVTARFTVMRTLARMP